VPVPLASLRETGMRTSGVGRNLERTVAQLRSDMETHGELCMAAVHVGVNAHLMVLRDSATLINARVVEQSLETVSQLEASTFAPNALQMVARPKWVQVEFASPPPHVEMRNETFDGVEARCVVHLLDELAASSALGFETVPSR